MSVSLKKGQKVSLTKDNAGLRSVVVGLGWDEVEQPKAKGVFGGLFGGKPAKVHDIDCDAVVFLLDSEGKIAQRSDVVFFNNLRHSSDCVIHQGDNLTGGGEGDDEQIMVYLSKLPPQYERVVVLVSIYKATERNQHFGMIKNAFIRIFDADTNKELYKYDLSENYDGMTALVFGELYRKNGEWKFSAVGQPLQLWSIADLAERWGLPKSVWHK